MNCLSAHGSCRLPGPLIQFAQRVRPNSLFLFIGLFATSCLVGCAAPRGIANTTAGAHVLLLPGIMGAGPSIGGIKRLIENELSDTSVQIYDWTRVEQRTFALANLTRYSLNLARGQALTNQMVAWRRAHADVNLYVVAISGGVGIALFSADSLPEDFHLRRMVLLSGAVSPQYDLTRAMHVSDKGILAYSSVGDTCILRDGTRRYGTMDRVYSESAGYSGFVRPDGDQSNLRQLYWKKGDRRCGNDGRPQGALARPYFREFILPFLRDEWIGPAPARDERSSTAAGYMGVNIT